VSWPGDCVESGREGTARVSAALLAAAGLCGVVGFVDRGSGPCY